MYFPVTVCPPIDHCNHRRCSSTSDNICVFCDGEVAEKEYYRAYTPIPSGKAKCERKYPFQSFILVFKRNILESTGTCKINQKIFILNVLSVHNITRIQY